MLYHRLTKPVCYPNTRLETLSEALADLREHTPEAYTQKVAVIHEQVQQTLHNDKSQLQLACFLLAPWSEQE